MAQDKSVHASSPSTFGACASPVDQSALLFVCQSSLISHANHACLCGIDALPQLNVPYGCNLPNSDRNDRKWLTTRDG